MIRKNDALDYHRAGTAREARGRPDEAARHAARSVARLLARRRRAVPRDRRQSRDGLGVHGARQPGRRRHQRHGGPRPRQHRPARRQAGDGGQGLPLQEVRRHRRLRSRARRDGLGPLHRRSSPRSSRPSAASTSRTSRRPSASRSRPALRARMDDPGLPRRPARHGHHLGRGAAQRRRAHRQEARPISRSSSPARAPRRSPAPTSTSRSASPLENITMVDSVGVIYEGREQGMNQSTRRGSRARTTAPARAPTRCAAPTCSWVCRRRGSARPRC